MLKQDLSAAYVINLPRRADRLQRAKLEYPKLGLPLKLNVYPAFNVKGFGWTLDETEGSSMNRGAMGCTLSHLAVAKAAIMAGQKNVVVMEDDFRVLPSFNWSPLVTAPADADILAFGWMPWGGTLADHVTRKQINPAWMISENAAGTFFYIMVNPLKVAAVLESTRHYHQLDNVYQREAHAGRLNYYHTTIPTVGFYDYRYSDANG